MAYKTHSFELYSEHMTSKQCPVIKSLYIDKSHTKLAQWPWLHQYFNKKRACLLMFLIFYQISRSLLNLDGQN